MVRTDRARRNTAPIARRSRWLRRPKNPQEPVPGTCNLLSWSHLRRWSIVVRESSHFMSSRNVRLSSWRAVEVMKIGRKWARSDVADGIRAERSLKQSFVGAVLLGPGWCSALAKLRGLRGCGQGGTQGGRPRLRASGTLSQSLVLSSTIGISPRSTSPDSRIVILRVGGDDGRRGGGGPMNGSAGG